MENDDRRHLDRHHEPDRAAGRQRPVAGAQSPSRRPDGTYKLFGTKIFITYGEHDMAGQHRSPGAGRVAGALKA